MRTLSAAFILFCATGTLVQEATAQSRVGVYSPRHVQTGLQPFQQPAEFRGGYCVAAADGTGLGLDERIINVTFAGINNTTANAAPVAPAYTAYLGSTASVTAGMSYPISIGVSSSLAGGTSYAENQALVWIDYNQDQDFDDLGELAFVSAIGAVTAYTGNIIIPDGAFSGTTRMRIRLHDTHDGTDYINNYNDTPCGTASYGEIEDYSVNITGVGYCDAGADGTGLGLDERIVNVTFATINNNSPDAVPVAPAYADFTGVTGNVTAGLSYPISIDVARTGATTSYAENQALVWIDFNQDDDFNDGGELVFVSAIGSVEAYTGNITIPGGAATGVTRMRIRLHDTHDGTDYINNFNDTPCGIASYGEVEDYSINIAGAGGGYCTAGADGTGLGLDERIINVTMSNINNNSPNAAPVAPSYSDFTGVIGNVTQGQTYAISVGVSSAINSGYNTNQVLAWIDFNQDEDFGDVGEQVFVSTIEALAAYTGNITIPVTALTGTTRMRIRLHDTHDGSLYINNFNDTPCGLASYGEVEDYSISITGTTVTPVNDDCAGASIASLSTPGTITMSGDNTGATIDAPTTFTLVWEAFTITQCSNVTVSYCVVGSEFTAFFVNLGIACPDFLTGLITGGVNPDNCSVSFFDLPAGTYYIPVRVETDGSTPIGPYTIEVSAEPCAPVGPYCEASANALTDEKISNVTFADVNNNSSSVAGYEDFTSQTASVVGGVSYPISVTISTPYSTDQVLAWIDWDHNQVFDAGEIVFSSTIGVGPHTGNVAVPLTATAGPTRMRVRLHDTYTGANYQNTPNPTPCDTSTYGQVEDYTVDMIGIITGVNDVEAGTWSVYPNPSNGDFVVRYAGRDGRATIEVLDMTGRTVHAEQRAVAAGAILPLSLAGDVATGTYILRITTDEGSEERRIVVR